MRLARRPPARLPPQQYRAFLAIAADECEQLFIAPYTAAGLANRISDADLVVKRAAPLDRRRIELRLTRRALALLAELTQAHIDELRMLEAAFMAAWMVWA